MGFIKIKSYRINLNDIVYYYIGSGYVSIVFRDSDIQINTSDLKESESIGEILDEKLGVKK